MMRLRSWLISAWNAKVSVSISISRLSPMCTSAIDTGCYELEFTEYRTRREGDEKIKISGTCFPLRWISLFFFSLFRSWHQLERHGIYNVLRGFSWLLHYSWFLESLFAFRGSRLFFVFLESLLRGFIDSFALELD
jgi:hypothetical protein